MKFTLEIELGSEGMQTAWEVADALNDAARRIRTYNVSRELTGINGPVCSFNGNTVGKWEVTA